MHTPIQSLDVRNEVDGQEQTDNMLAKQIFYYDVFNRKHGSQWYNIIIIQIQTKGILYK